MTDGTVQAGGMSTTATPRPARVESFRNWLTVAMSTPSLRHDLRARVSRHEPEDLPALIEVACEAELACLVRLAAFNRRVQEDRRRAEIRGAKQPMSIEEYAARVERWYERVKWLQDVRMYLRTGPRACVPRVGRQARVPARDGIYPHSDATDRMANDCVRLSDGRLSGPVPPRRLRPTGGSLPTPT